MQEKIVKRKAYAKLNLTLDIVGQRDDGYHLLETLMQTFSLYDELEFFIKENTGDSSGNQIYLETLGLKIDGEIEKNLCYRAAKLFFNEFNIKNKILNIKINKKIPVGAGLGGGSSDCAQTIKFLAEEFNVTREKQKIKDICLKLGADVPFFIEGGFQRAGGIGEILTPIKRTFDYTIVLAKPEKSANTKEIYTLYDNNKIQTNHTTSVLNSLNETENSIVTQDSIKKSNDKNNIINYIGNCLQDVTYQICPEVNVIKNQLLDLGALTACMTGSGTAVFGLFENEGTAVKAENEIKKITNFSGVYNFI